MISDGMPWHNNGIMVAYKWRQYIIYHYGNLWQSIHEFLGGLDVLLDARIKSCCNIYATFSLTGMSCEDQNWGRYEMESLHKYYRASSWLDFWKLTSGAFIMIWLCEYFFIFFFHIKLLMEFYCIRFIQSL